MMNEEVQLRCVVGKDGVYRLQDQDGREFAHYDTMVPRQMGEDLSNSVLLEAPEVEWIAFNERPRFRLTLSIPIEYESTHS